MAEYFKWDLYKNNPAAKFLVYGGKLSELLCGILLLLGFLTRIACLMLIAAMCYIAFVIGNGRIWYEDQYPILFAVIGVIFIFTGPGAYSIDKKLFNH
jgi:putative oxidoreductase